ncbi:hypothetical protein C2G38_367102 [Gigaspora rosea]|uniref:Protein kinase domain-containing protein n=1 Tax=Gigaspora rosea TaxID=44941 RepID=A0A397UM53_9GLOM|nr:hypothetical protein C2G38_367102 [Gigaspora rosea]
MVTMRLLNVNVNVILKINFVNGKMQKIIISCRPEYLGSDYQKRFFPQNGKKGFQELTIKAFSETEVQQYIAKYVQNKRHLLDWSEDTYLQQIKRIPKDLVSNPILLKITLIALPRFTKQQKTTQINRIALYDEFLKTWFDRAQDRLYKIHKTNKEEEAFSNLNINDFTESCLQFSKNFAAKMFIDNNKVVITYNSNWATFLGNKDIENSLLRFSMPLIRRENQYWFLHKSLRDHLIAQALLEPNESALNTALFNKQSFVSEHGVRQFLAEHMYQKMETFKPQLLSFIETSKKDDEVQIASANAITILTQVDVLLDNLNDANISGADLSNKIFNNLQTERAKLNQVNFQNTELKNANLRSSFLQSADFQNAKLQNADLRGSSFQNAHFNDADLSFADFRNTILQDVNFKNANLRNTSLQNACIKNADLTFADFQNTILVDIYFQEMSTENVNDEIYNVGYCYQNGVGVEKDEQKAFAYYQKSAEMGNASGTCSIGYCYRHGIGVEKDELKAFIYYQRSADMGDANGMCNVGYCYQNGIGIEKDEHMAFYYYLKSAKLGCYGGMYHVGYCYRNGSGTSQDFKKASEWLYKAKTNKCSYETKPYTEDCLYESKCLVPQIPINDVEFYGKFGEGAFASVYLARWKSNGLTQPIVLKLFPKLKENFSEENFSEVNAFK